MPDELPGLEFVATPGEAARGWIQSLMLLSALLWATRSPGDMNVTRENFSFRFHLVTCLVISTGLTPLM